MTQPAVGRARVPGNGLPVAKCVPPCCPAQVGVGNNHLWALVGARKNAFCCGRVASGSFGRGASLGRVGGEDAAEGFRGAFDFTKALP